MDKRSTAPDATALALDLAGALLAITAVRAIHMPWADGTCIADGETYPCPTVVVMDQALRREDVS